MAVNITELVEVGSGDTEIIQPKDEKQQFTLIIEEFDDRKLFWTGSGQFESTIVVQLNQSHMDSTISHILSSFIPLRMLEVADGHRHMTRPVNSQKRYKPKDRIGDLFKSTKSTKVHKVKLYIHFGSAFLSSSETHVDYFKTRVKELEECLKIPGFANSESARHLVSLMNDLNTVWKIPKPSTEEIQRKLQDVNRLIHDYYKDNVIQNPQEVPEPLFPVGWWALAIYGVLGVIFLLYFFLFR